ncbi:MAG: tRNA(Leu) C34 or U34 (ribose-2'-O)-methylase TrmL [Arenicella sp.]|jgi:tRNA(Leu) C34 or U34 (ribose-2'-O)-methylase TrmL
MANETLVFIGLCNPKSPTNVGAIMRAVGCYQADQVIYTGVRFDRATKYQTDTHNTRDTVPLNQVEDIVESMPDGMQLVCVEFVEGATPLPEFQHPQQAMYLFGPEDGSISQSLVDEADHVVYIPTRGCMNLSASVNVLLYDRLAKSDCRKGDESIVLSSRDVNNRLKVKSKSKL